MSTLLQSFEKFVNKEALFTTEDDLLIAVSGGLDSVVLLHLLMSLKYSTAIAHCNFQLRGKDSDQDAAFIEALGKSFHAKVHLQKFDTTTYTENHQISTQLAARELRYRWFEELLTSHKYKYLLTAHHANDQVETMLYNLTKGTGIAGLRGIPLKNNYVRRPLLFAKREEIELYAKEHQLEWREDASNQQDKYSRNHLRLNVIPELKEINPGLEQTMLQNSRRFDALEKLLMKEVSSIKGQFFKQKNTTYFLGMEWYDESKGGLSVLTEILKPYGFNFDQCISIGEATKAQAIGKQFYSRKFVLAIDRERISIVPQQSNESFSILISDINQLATVPFADFTLEITDKNESWSKDTKVANLDADLISLPLKIRNWNQGDFFIPLGMKGKKKISDFMIDEKIPVNLKSRVTLFESNDDIIWVAGYRIDDRYKVTPKTKRVLIIKMTDHV